MSFIIYPLLLGLSFALSKLIDIWYVKKVTKTDTNNWRTNPHFIWIMFIIGIVIGVLFTLFLK